VFEGNKKQAAVITAPWRIKCCSDVLPRPQFVDISENDLLLLDLLLLDRCCADCWDPAFVMDED
jgi:hypothetical protein